MEVRCESLQSELRHHHQIKITVITGSPRKEGNTLAMVGVTMQLHCTFHLLKWNLVGEVCVPGVFHVGDVSNTDGCAQAAALAEKF